MTDRLLELAEKAGVAIKSNAYHVDRGIGSYTRPRQKQLVAPLRNASSRSQNGRWR